MGTSLVEKELNEVKMDNLSKLSDTELYALRTETQRTSMQYENQQMAIKLLK